ncbi:F0F1 ATP synthase subunit A [Pyxidicoccus xibeiensis]|uniref:F0F1 ATP synthase subunit A n=1 Tax=Pyxidicoccus xibeiensis TaxID=2906759 RepID=UPI0020A786D5|nr:F0F1 ATP synthase subunit A [Pyxidicoccus xibeiensis]MCP3136496.1 F0F1 ATP synthase subunit A [Pyxidicoccus xibeiensis]
MRKAMVLFASLFASVAWASSSAEGEESVAGYILHHVSDADELEIEVPLSHDHIKLHLPKILIPLSEGACAPRMTDHGPVTPSLLGGCVDLSITKHTVFMWLAAFLLITFVLIWSNRDKTKLVPRGTGANLFEMLILFVRDELAIKNIGKEEGPRYVPFLLTAFFFILFMNLLGLFPWMASATGNLAVTCGLAICTFVVTQAAGIRAAGFGGYLAHLTGGVHPALWFIMIPVEFLGLFTKPFALTVRLFANMLAGHIVIFFLLGLIFILQHPAVALISVPFAFGIYLLELFVAFVQAYVFTMLSALFIGMGVAMGHHGHGDDHGHGHAETGPSHDHGRAHHV